MSHSNNMDEVTRILIRSSLFNGLSRDQIDAVANRMQARFASVPKGDLIFTLHQQVSCFDYLVSGRVEIATTDAWGDKHILSIAGPGQTIGGILAFSDVDKPPANAVALTDCRLILFDRNAICHRRDDPLGECFSILIGNFTRIIVDSKLQLMKKLDTLSQRTIRKKILTFLSYQSESSGSRSFDIPFDRQQMANYLNVERSSLSAELGKLRSEGIIDFSKNHFRLSGFIALECALLNENSSCGA
ncbi:Crp/Fnr family transcriptional regulator [Curtanaerobium respiraculi]|uniref:Crp/Fnr family transcriptional regulator n=1 Tax=Curtanaerobium respiraculi TaxID=2949669 RepID=UPI0024B36D0E|nr:Crp/Fnr family transcriptional regulator [Curtanaerobium respiraculi]